MKHETDEALSAFIDREGTPEDMARIRGHVGSCQPCRERLAGFEAVHSAVSNLDAPLLTPAERSALRQVGSRRPRRSWSPRTAWALSGAAAALLITFAVVATLSRDAALNPTSQTKDASRALSESAAGGAEALAQDFGNPEEVGSAVSSNRQVLDGLQAYAVEDVGSLQAAAVTGLSRDGSSQAEADQKAQGRAPAPATSPGPSLRQCLETVFTKQPFALMPIYSAAARYQGALVWIMAYAYTTGDDPRDRLDKLLIWVVRQSDCSEVSVITYSKPLPASSASP